jgi:hypothetical protein
VKSGVEYLAQHPGWKSAKRKPRRHLARFTVAENHAWCAHFEYAVMTLKYGALRADGFAWRRVCEEFPRLRKFQGARP